MAAPPREGRRSRPWQFASAAAPNQVWLADLTCIATGEGWLYPAAIMDPAANPSGFGEFSRRVVGWAMSETMPQELTLAALRAAHPGVATTG